MKLPFGNVRGVHASTELLSSYLDNQVTPEERLGLEQHLRTCANCRAELNSLRQTVTLMRSMPRVPVPRAFTLSEARVGAARRAVAPWYVGAARAFGAVAAVAVVAALAVLLLRQPGQQPATAVARLPQPAAAPTNPQATLSSQPSPTSPELAPQAPAAPATQPGAGSNAEPALTAPAVQQPPTQPALAQVPAAQAPAARGGATAAPRAQVSAAASSPQVPTLQAAGAARKLSPSPEPSAASSAPAVPALAPVPATGQPEPAAQPSIEPAQQDQSPMLMAAPAAAPTGMMGLGGGGAPSTAGESALLPPAVPISVLPAGAGVIYGDRQTLTAVDTAGTHRLAQAPGVSVPVVSSDRAWVAYRVQSDAGVQIWAVRWDGSNPHPLADGANFPFPDGKGSALVQIDRVQFVPGSHTVSMLVYARSGSSGATRVELWTVKVEGNNLHYVLDVSETGDAFFSPDGRMVAVLSRGGPSQPQGTLTLAGADGAAKRTVLQFPANVNGFGYPTQISWLPDSSGLWVAIPDPDVLSENGGLKLYRVPAQAASPDGIKPANHITGLETYWSPDGTRLAYMQPLAGGDTGDRQLMLADADGSNPRAYATVKNGAFSAWSPDGKYFLYTADTRWYLGSAGGQPVPFGSPESIREAHWVSARQALYLLNQGDSWALVALSMDGKSSSLPVRVPIDNEITITGH